MGKPTAQEMWKLAYKWAIENNIDISDEQINDFFAQYGWDFRNEFLPIRMNGGIDILDVK